MKTPRGSFFVSLYYLPTNLVFILPTCLLRLVFHIMLRNPRYTNWSCNSPRSNERLHRKLEKALERRSQLVSMSTTVLPDQTFSISFTPLILPLSFFGYTMSRRDKHLLSPIEEHYAPPTIPLLSFATATQTEIPTTTIKRRTD